MPAVRGCMVASLIGGASGWVSTSQARFGATISGIKNEMKGTINYPVQQSLGYLWSLPTDSQSDRGLGQSITWAWDDTLCDLLSMEEDFWEMSFIGCEEIRASMHRAFQSWSMNHKHISFTEVTEDCKKLGQLREGCAEIWVTALDSSDPTYGAATSNNGTEAAQSAPSAAATSAPPMPQISPAAKTPGAACWRSSTTRQCPPRSAR